MVFELLFFLLTAAFMFDQFLEIGPWVELLNEEKSIVVNCLVHAFKSVDNVWMSAEEIGVGILADEIRLKRMV